MGSSCGYCLLSVLFFAELTLRNWLSTFFADLRFSRMFTSPMSGSSPKLSSRMAKKRLSTM